MKVVFYETNDADAGTLRALLQGVDAAFSAEKLTLETAALAKGADSVVVFVNSMVSKEVIDALAGVKLIATASTGYDHIDAAYAKQKGVAVANVPAYGSHTVAEFTFALILALSRKLIHAHHHVRDEDRFDLGDLCGFDLNGKTIGVVGTGRIGKNVIRIAKGFEMQVLAFDLMPDAAAAASGGFAYVALPELLAKSDVVTIHVPYTKETHHLLNAQTIPLMKKTAVLINTARGEVVELDALLRAIRGGTIAGAGIDVIEGERDLKDEATLLLDGRTDATRTRERLIELLEAHELIRDPRVIATPHIAFFTVEAREQIVRTTADNILAFAAGTPQNLVAA